MTTSTKPRLQAGTITMMCGNGTIKRAGHACRGLGLSRAASAMPELSNGCVNWAAIAEAEKPNAQP